MYIDIVIPTRGRYKKLKNCLNSIIAQITSEKIAHTQIIVYMDTQPEVDEFLSDTHTKESFKNVHFCTIPFPYTAPKLWNLHLKIMSAHGMLYLNDDVALAPGCIKQARMDLLLNYPTYDGLVGIRQVNLEGRFDTAPAAFGLIGREFAARFPDKQAFCPDYKHLYIDREIEAYARTVDRFKMSKAALFHYHPCLDASWHDHTHDHIRRFKNADSETFKLRQQRHLTWGITFDRVNNA